MHTVGNDALVLITNQKDYMLRVEMRDVYNNTAYAVYGTFVVASEDGGYTLTIGSYTGNAGW